MEKMQNLLLYKLLQASLKGNTLIQLYCKKYIINLNKNGLE